MKQEFISPEKFVRLGWEYSQERRIQALANYDDRTLEIPQPPLPKYEPKPKEKWSPTSIRAFAHGLLP